MCGNMNMKVALLCRKGGDKMNNLKAEMARYGVSERDIQNLLECSINTVRNKLNGSTDFSFPESIKIRDHFFVGYSLEYLFADETTKSA